VGTVQVEVDSRFCDRPHQEMKRGMNQEARLVLDPKRQSRSREYARLRRRLVVGSWAVSGVYLGVWALLRWGPKLSRTLESFATPRAGGAPWWLELLAIAVAVGLPYALLSLPVNFYAGFVLSLVLGTPLLVGLYAVMRASPDLWWLWAALGYSAVSVVLSALAPVVLMPIFFKFRPLDQAHAALNERLLELARRSGTRVRGVFTFDMSRRTRAANAALVGLGATRRVILGDTLLSEFKPEEIETVLAHELGHHVHMDIPLFIVVQSGLNLLTFFFISVCVRWASPGLGLASVADPGGLPVLALLAGVLSVIIGPLANAFSRWREALADRYALQLTHNRESFVSAMTRLANQNLAEADPPDWAVWLFSTHPPIGRRIRLAEESDEATVNQSP
jgi:STE24 endopeptidase